MTDNKHTRSFLDNIRIIMTHTTLPANIGSAARAMMTMGLKQLALVNPKYPIDDTSRAHAKGGLQVLRHAKIFPNLPTALSDCALVIATSSRKRHVPRPMLDPKSLALLLDDFYSQNPLASIAIVFGQEDRGLSNDELALADYHLQIHANPAYSVLNVASSIQVIAAFLYDYINTQPAHFYPKNSHTDRPNITIIQRQHWDAPAITQQEKSQLNQCILALLQQHNLTNENLFELPARLSRLTSRLQLDKKEYALLMALLHRLSRS